MSEDVRLDRMAAEGTEEESHVDKGKAFLEGEQCTLTQGGREIQSSRRK